MARYLHIKRIKRFTLQEKEKEKGDKKTMAEIIMGSVMGLAFVGCGILYIIRLKGEFKSWYKEDK